MSQKLQQLTACRAKGEQISVSKNQHQEQQQLTSCGAKGELDQQA